MIVIMHQLYDYLANIYAPRKIKNMSDLYSKKYADIIDNNKNNVNILNMSQDINPDFASEYERDMLINRLNMFTNDLK
jgi:predicted transcriptional regulator